MSKYYHKQNFPVSQIRRFLEPGPIVLVSSRWKGKANIMTMGWHTVLEFEPSLVGCMITSANHSYEMIRKSKECVINIPTVEMAKTVVGIGNCTGAEVNKFDEFGVTAVEAETVGAPLIAECFANLECRLHDKRMLKDYNFFIFEVVKAHAPARPKYPRTIHYRGEGSFMTAGESLNLKRMFKSRNL